MIVLCKDTDPQWKTLRADGLTASSLPGLLGLVPWEKRSQDEILADYARGLGVDDTPAMWLGRVTEAPAVAKAAEMMGWHRWEASHELVCRPGEEWLKATLDAWVWPIDDDRRHPAECKFHRFATKDKGTPDHIRAQVQVQLWITGEPWSYLIRTVAGEWPAVTVVEYDGAQAEALVAEGRGLWARIQEMRREAAA